MFYILSILALLILYYMFIKAIKELNATYKKILKKEKEINKKLNILHKNIDIIYNLCLDNNNMLIEEKESISSFVDDF